MTWGFTAQRRADEFNDLVEAPSTGPGATRDADLLELVGALRATPEIHARPEFVADLRSQLMAAADTALVPADTSKLRLPDRQPRRERRLAAVVGGIAIVGATTSVAVASQSALPGDTLYPIKRAIEGAHTGLSVGEGNKGTTVLASASDRLTEVDELTRQDRDAVDDLRIAQTLTTFTDQATQASDLLLSDYEHRGDEASIAALRDFASTSIDRLAALEPYIPAEARDELIRAAQVLQTIDAEAAQTCPSCGGRSIDSVPAVFAAPQVLLPVVQAEPEPVDTGKKHGSKQHGGGKNDGGSDLPSVSPDDVGPGSVTNPVLPPVPGSSTTQNPLQDLVDGVTGGGGASSPSSQGGLPDVGEALGDVGALISSIVDPVLDPLTQDKGQK